MATTPDQFKSPAILTGSSANRPSRYEAPYRYDGSPSSQDRILGWMREAISEGEWFLKSQTGYRFVDHSYRIMNDIGFDELPATLSKSSANFVKRDVREQIGMLSNPRPITSYKTLNPKFDPQTFIMNQLYMGWYYMQFVDRALAGALKYAGVEGTGYLMMEWDSGYFGGRADIKMTPLGVDAVLPVQIDPESWDLQSSYAVVIRRQMAITHVLRRFPQFAHMITPDGESVGRLRRIINNIRDVVTPTVHNTYGSQRGYRGEDPSSRHYVTVYDIYIHDSQCNLSNGEIKMGLKNSPWEYTVPAYGSDVPLPYGYTDGQMVMRPANYHDARLFPHMRHVVATRNCILKDDTSVYWHCQVPVTKFTLDAWPQEYCGIPLTKEPAKMQAMATSLLRAYDDTCNAKLRPPMTYDGNRTTPAEARAFDARSGGQLFEANDSTGQPVFRMAVDPAIYQMGADTLKTIDYCRQMAADLIGNPGMKELSKAAQIPSGDSIEKLMEIAGPLPTENSRNMEASLRCMGEQFKALAFEFYNARRRFTILGPDGITEQDYDFDPGELIPAQLAMDGLPPNATRSQRARAFMEQIYFWVLPNSMYQITQSTRKLLTLQLARMGAPISWYTIMEQFDIPNPGRPPALPDGKQPVTEVEKWIAWKLEEARVMIAVQMELTKAQIGMGMMQDAASPLGQLSGAIQQAVQSKPGGDQGRPPSGQQSPHVETKDGGTRATVAES